MFARAMRAVMASWISLDGEKWEGHVSFDCLLCSDVFGLFLPDGVAEILKGNATDSGKRENGD